MKIRSLLIMFLSFLTHTTYCQQQTVGLLNYKKDKSFEGYNLIYPHNQGNVYLLNNCGEIVHVWEDGFEYHPGITAYLMPDGKLIKAKRLKNTSQDTITGGGSGASVEIRDWDNNLLALYTLNNSKRRLHHDIAPMPNGNVLVIAWEPKNRAEIVKAGRDTTRFTENRLLSEVILEINPYSGETVWEWSLWDHLVQDFDPTKDNFGVVADSPRKIDINYPSISSSVTWMHMNAIDYNPFLNQIIVSLPTYEEVWVIDHSTTTQQATGSTGGLSGVGGDLMYRWGNPRTYKRGTVANQKLFFQHDIHWILDFISQADPDFGKLAVFNNRAGANFSTAGIFNPPWDMYEWRYTMKDGVWGPDDFDRIFMHPIPEKLYSDGLSSVQLLPNRNVLIHSGRQGYAFELTASGEIVWEYKVPLKNGLPVSQGTNLVLNDNITFRMKRYPVDYTAFQGKDLTRKGWIENSPNENYCNQLVFTHDEKNPYRINKLYPNPASSVVFLDYESSQDTEVLIYNIQGQSIKTLMLHPGINEIYTGDMAPGLYFIHTDSKGILKAFSVVR